MSYDVILSPEAIRSLNKLPTKARDALIAAMYGSISESPRSAGKPLRFELEVLYSARRGEYRVIYDVDDKTRMVRIIRAEHRRRAYRKR